MECVAYVMFNFDNVIQSNSSLGEMQTNFAIVYPYFNFITNLAMTKGPYQASPSI